MALFLGTKSPPLLRFRESPGGAIFGRVYFLSPPEVDATLIDGCSPFYYVFHQLTGVVACFFRHRERSTPATFIYVQRFPLHVVKSPPFGSFVCAEARQIRRLRCMR